LCIAKVRSPEWLRQRIETSSEALRDLTGSGAMRPLDTGDNNIFGIVAKD
jgi:hypothetical protein